MDRGRASAYRARPNRDRAIAAIPDILWRGEERRRRRAEETEEASAEHSRLPVSAEELDARLLELYALAQEYALEPASLSTVHSNVRVNELANLQPSDDEAYLNDLERFFEDETGRTSDLKAEEPERKEELEGAEETDGDAELKSAVAARRADIKSAIVELMSDPELRSRYLAEIASERVLRRSRGARSKLNAILKLQALISRTQTERRRLRVEEFLAREHGDGTIRTKAAGRTPQALQNLERGVTVAQDLEEQRISQLNNSERGLLMTELLLQRKRQLEEKGL